MTVNEWANLVVSILSGIAVCVPLVIKLVQYIKAAIKEKNWTNVMQIVLRLMTEAEKNYATGVERKAYVMDSIIAIQDTLNYDIDLDAISAMIDSIVAASKVINAEVKAEG